MIGAIASINFVSVLGNGYGHGRKRSVAEKRRSIQTIKNPRF
jgi:hypothetical protein